jgi:phage terminase small subunit
MAKLTDKQQRFVEEYLIDLNATQAAIRAGYSEKTANEQGARLLVNVSIQEAIQAAKQQRSQATGITAETVLQQINELREKAMREIVVGEYGDPRMESPATAAKCLEMLGKHVGLFEKDNSQKQPEINIVGFRVVAHES